MKKLFKFWIGLDLTTPHYAYFKNADELRQYIKSTYPQNTSYGFQVQ